MQTLLHKLRGTGFLQLVFPVLFFSFIVPVTAQVKPWNIDDYQDSWVKVYTLRDKGLPKSALDELNQLQARAKEEGNTSQYIKSLLYSVKLNADYEESPTEKSIAMFREEIKIAKSPEKQILQSALAELFWNYYQSNRHEWLGRKTTTGIYTEDVKTWDLKTLVDQIVKQYKASLEDEVLLKSTSLKKYDVLLSLSENSKQFRPTLYDFLANRAVDFFMDGETYLTKPANTFFLDDPAYFSPAPIFCKLQLHSSDSLSLKFYALQILQDLIRFHVNDKYLFPVLDVDLKRLAFVKSAANLENKDSLYRASLIEMTKVYAGFEGVTDVLYQLACEYRKRGETYNPLLSDAFKWDLKTADSVCDLALLAFPESYGAKYCKMAKESIHARQLNLTLNYGNIPDKPFLGLLAYRNISNVSFRIVKVDPETLPTLLQRLDDKQRLDYYLAEKAVNSWTISLPADPDLQDHKTEIKIPSLLSGSYVIIACSGPAFAVDTEVFSLTPLIVTNISFISEKKEDGGYELFIMDRSTGNALSNVKVSAYTYLYDNTTGTRNKKLMATYYSDKSGYLRIQGPVSREYVSSFYFVFDAGSDHYVSDDNFFLSYSQNFRTPIVQVSHFFTDRAIYRPGQTVWFKAITIKGYDNKFELVPNLTVNVTLKDVNYRQVSTILSLVTNDFGSVSGSFTIPEGSLNGMMMIVSDYGSASIRVEEYKRPKFEIQYEPVSGSYKLGEEVTIKGKAMAYAGSSIAGASVKYRVVRLARFPYWFDYRIAMPNSPSTEILNGTLETSADGIFEIRFRALADKMIPLWYKPTFTYAVYADVTDVNGETHSNETKVSVGVNALNISIDIPDNLNLEDRKQFSIKTENTNGVFEAASGKLTIQRLIQPEYPLKKKQWDRADKFCMLKADYKKDFPNEIFDNEDDKSIWPVEVTCLLKEFNTALDSNIIIPDLKNWKPGVYSLVLNSKDVFGKAVELKRYITVFAPNSTKSATSEYFWKSVLTETAEPGTKAVVLFGTKAKKMNVLYEIAFKEQILLRKWQNISNEQLKIEFPVKEEYRGNLSFTILAVNGNSCYFEKEMIKVPFSNKDLEFSFETFRNKLLPGEKEKLEIKIRGTKAEQLVSEVLFGMYDASLDVFEKNIWSLDLFKAQTHYAEWNNQGLFKTTTGSLFRQFSGFWDNDLNLYERPYDNLNWFGYQMSALYPPVLLEYRSSSDKSRLTDGGRPQPLMRTKSLEGDAEPGNQGMYNRNTTQALNSSLVTNNSISLENSKLRSDFRETAFFYPDMRTNEKGEIILEFSMPDALTRWNLMGFAHTKDLRIGTTSKEFVTQKDLMIFPNLPRFVREGDTVRIDLKISSLKGEISGEASIELLDALTMKPIERLIFGGQDFRSFSCSKGKNALVGWTILIPEGIQAIIVRTKATAGNFTDAEENVLPVLFNRILITESMPLPVNGNSTKTFTFAKLKNPGSSTLQNYKLSLEFTSNPIWYAVQALPFLMEGQQGCTEEIFNKLFANSIGTYVAMMNPRIQQVFGNWKSFSPSALVSNLEKNEDLKNISLQETPWIGNGASETDRKHRVGALFDFNRMENEQEQAIRKLIQLQLPNGGWPWFAGLPDNRYITQYILTGMGRMEKMGLTRIKNDQDAYYMVAKACRYMDQKITDDYNNHLKAVPSTLDPNTLEPYIAQYFYGRSFYLKSIPVDAANKPAFDYYSRQISKFWLNLNPYLQAMTALSLNRMENKKTADEILRSLNEKALHSAELGMYWRDIRGYSWYENPIQAQALLIEAFDEIRNDRTAVDDMKKWLLKQKQTQDWQSSVATAEACYALLHKSSDLLESQNLAVISLGNKLYNPESSPETKVEAGTGYFRTSWSPSEFTPEMGDIKIVNNNPACAWGAMYWQYFEQLDKITPQQSPLSVSKQLFVETNTPSGPVIKPISNNSTLVSGDKITVRIVLNTDRNLEFVHLKDLRAAGFEAVNVVSGYKYQDGLSYYESTKDAATNFYFPNLQKGTYVFEYSLVATVKGAFSNGISTVQCLYAPEFSAHSEGIRVKIQ